MEREWCLNKHPQNREEKTKNREGDEIRKMKYEDGG